MKLRYKVLIGTGVALPLITLSGLLTLGSIARGRGVHRIDIPSGSLVESTADGANYIDSYSASVPSALFPNVDAIDRFAFQRGALVARNDEEILYTGESPGLRFYISYRHEGPPADKALAVTTVVHYQNWRGWLYFAAVRPVHRVLAPFMLSVMIRRAQAASERPAA